MGIAGQSSRAPQYGTLERFLRAGDVIKMVDGTIHFIQYVNTSGAYAVPLAGIQRDIKGHTINFTAGGRTISAASLVEHVNPLTLGGNSQEYRAYARMLAKSKGEGKGMADTDTKGETGTDTGGVALGEFDSSPHETTIEESGGGVAGHAAAPESETAGKGKAAKSSTKSTKSTKNNKKETDMAMATKANGRAKAKAGNGKAAKRAKVAKAVRACACGCGAETTGYFAPGHDARLHGLIAKLADGRIEPKAYPYPSTIKKLELQQTKSGYRATKPHFYKD